MKGLSKSEMVSALMTACNLTKADAAAIVEAVGGMVMDSLSAGQKVRFAGMTLRPVLRKARKGRNMVTGEMVDIPSKVVVSVSVGRVLDESLNG